jgi:hypothetical protein
MIGLLAALGTAIGVLVAVVGLPYGRANYTAFAGIYHNGGTFAPAGHLAIDCDTVLVGVQDVCAVVNTPGTQEIDVVFADNSAAGTIGSMANLVRNPGTHMTGVVNAEGALNDNPDFNEAGPGASGTWNCSLVLAPTENNGFEAGPVENAELQCFVSAGSGPAHALGADVKLSDITYNKIAASVGNTVLTFGQSGVNGGSLVADNDGIELVSCNGSDTLPGTGDDGQCFGALLIFSAPPDTATPLPTDTPTPLPTATDTPLPTATPAGATLNKIPEGNENNVDLAIPAANLWICVTGPCAGPGEGNLIVFEYATNVNTGDFNGDTIVDGLGAYEFVVEYDNFVIASVNPSDVVFNPGPIAPYPGGADGILDGEGAARAPATCNFSITTENFVRFGCVTSGALPAGPTGDMDIARLNLIPHEDLKSDLIPGNDNGVVTNLKDNNCELADVFGHPVTGSVNGGLLPVCGNLAVTVRMLEGDLNLDCVVDVQDQQLIAFRYASEFGSTLYNRFFDLEPNLQDLDIDIKDIQKVFGRDGSTCQNPIQPQPPLAPAVPF